MTATQTQTRDGSGVVLVALIGLEPDDRLVLDRILRRGRRLAGTAGRSNRSTRDQKVEGPWS